MIVTDIQNLKRYSSLHPLFAKAFDWISSTDLSALKAGRVELEGKDLFANVQEYQTRPVEESFFEAHRRYIDIQFLASGSEKIACASVQSLSEIESYNEETDFHKLQGKGLHEVLLTPGVICILFPEDAHEPSLVSAGSREAVKKICMKVRV